MLCWCDLLECAEIGGTFAVEDFGYDNDTLLKIMFRNIEETKFNGITVRTRST